MSFERLRTTLIEGCEVSRGSKTLVTLDCFFDLPDCCLCFTIGVFQEFEGVQNSVSRG